MSASSIVGETCGRQATWSGCLAYSLQSAVFVCDTVAKCGETKPFRGRALMVKSLVGSMTAHLRHSVVAVTVAAAMVGDCASGDTGAAEVWDPIETPHRFIFSLNRVVDSIALPPLAVPYRQWMRDGGEWDWR